MACNEIRMSCARSSFCVLIIAGNTSLINIIRSSSVKDVFLSKIHKSRRLVFASIPHVLVRIKSGSGNDEEVEVEEEEVVEDEEEETCGHGASFDIVKGRLSRSA